MTDTQIATALSRRSLVRTAAAAAAVGGTLALAGTAAAAEAADSPAKGEHVPAARIAEHPHHDAGAGVLVRVLDARLGTLEVYTQAGHRTVTDRALAAQLARLGR